MDLIKPINSQFQATLTMLEQNIIKCPAELWASNDYTNRFWHIAFHTLFYSHLYASKSEHDFRPWAKHKKNYEYLKYRSEGENGAAYSQEDLLEYLEFCRKNFYNYIGTVKFDDESGFSWLNLNRLELQFYNIRHIQHHAGQLSNRLRELEDIGIDWVGKTNL